MEGGMIVDLHGHRIIRLSAGVNLELWPGRHDFNSLIRLADNGLAGVGNGGFGPIFAHFYSVYDEQ
jgi:hypothetical protein